MEAFDFDDDGLDDQLDSPIDADLDPVSHVPLVAGVGLDPSRHQPLASGATVVADSDDDEDHL